MSKKTALCLVALLCLARMVSYAQVADSVTEKVIGFPSRLLGRIQGKTAHLDQQLTQSTEKYLQKMARREQRMKEKLSKSDSSAAKKLFAGSEQQYAALLQKMRTDTGKLHLLVSGQYQPYVDWIRKTRQVVDFVIGKRTKATLQ